MNPFNWDDHENFMNAFQNAEDPEEISRQVLEKEAADFQEHVNEVARQWQAYTQETDAKIQNLIHSLSFLIKENPLFHAILKNCADTETSLEVRKNEMSRLSEALQSDQETLARKKQEVEKIKIAFKQLQLLLVMQQEEKTPLSEFFDTLAEKASRALSNKLRERY